MKQMKQTTKAAFLTVMMAVMIPFAAEAAESEAPSMVSGFAALGQTETETEAETEIKTAVEGTEKTAEEETSPDLAEGRVRESAAGTGAAGLMDENKFLSDIKAANESRAAESARYSGAEVAAMTNQEIAEMNRTCAETERSMYEKYKEAIFRNKNLQYLCDLYMRGLENQFAAYDSWVKDSDITAYNELWDAGYSKRALALVEIVDTYGVDIPDMDDMRKTSESLSGKNDEEVSTDLDYDSVMKAQNDLNTLGFENTADGNYGARTAELIHRFQLMYGYEPADGALTEESLRQLEEEASKVLPSESEAAAETEG